MKGGGGWGVGVPRKKICEEKREWKYYKRKKKRAKSRDEVRK